MTVRELIGGMDVLAAAGDLEREVAGLAYDSRRVRAGDAFFALAGARHDGARFVRDAVAAGASAVVGPRGVEAPGVARLEVAEPRLALAQAANRLHGHPSRALRVVAVTGTNGKTTTTWMLESIFRAAGRSTGVIGTTGVRFAGRDRASAFTTPEAPELQALLAEMRDAGVEAVAMEVSSHALAQRRAWGLEPDACVFTNLSRDHLDFHRTMEDYLDAKLRLFDGRNGPTTKRGVAVVNAGDPSAARVAEACARGGLRLVAFDAGGGSPPAGLAPALAVTHVEARPAGLAIRARIAAGLGPGAGGARELAVRLPMLGRFNAANAAGALAAALALGVPDADAVRGLEALPGVPGRLERVDAGGSFLVVVDYAHTPDALERALAAVREHAPGRVLLVFGCGGDRDRGKRPGMGAAAARGADLAWITNDNPRGEDPAAIAAQVLAGAAGAAPGAVAVELDRRAAIGAALAAARPGDAVLVAGKGHETTQTTGDRVEPFDDRRVAREWLAGRSGS